MASESLGDYMDMLTEIEQGYDDEFSWVDSKFVFSMIQQLKENNDLSDKQKIAIRNIYCGRRK